MWGRIFRLVATAWLAIVATCAIAPPADAQARLAGEAITVCVRPADGPLDPKTAMADAPQFDCTSDQRDYGPGQFWAMSEPVDLASTPARPLALRAASLWQGEQTLHILYADGHVERSQIDGHGMSQRIQLGAIAQFALPPRDAPVVRLFWEIDDSPNLRGVLLGTRIVTLDESAQANLVMATL